MNRQRDQAGSRAELAAFLLLATAGTTIGYYLFLTATKFPTEEWYYLLSIAVTAVANDAVVAQATRNSLVRMLRPMVALVVAVSVFPVALQSVQTRTTNVDRIAQRLNQRHGG